MIDWMTEGRMREIEDNLELLGRVIGILIGPLPSAGN